MREKCRWLLAPVSASYRRYLAGVLVRQLMTVAGGFSLVWLLRLAAPGSDYPLWALIGGLLLFDAGVTGLDRILGVFFVSRVSLPLFRHLRVASLEKALSMPIEWHHERNAVELVSKLNNGAGKVVQTAETMGRELLPALIRTILSLLPLMWFSPWTTPCVLLSLGAFLWFTTSENRIRQKLRSLRHEQYARDSGMFTECVQNVQALIQFGQTDRMIARYDGLQKEIIAEGVGEMEIAHRYLAFRSALVSVTRRVCQGVWLWQYQSGKLDAPMVMYLNFLTDELIGSFGTYAGVLERVYEGIEPAKTVLNLLDEKSEQQDSPTGKIEDSPSPVAVELRRVGFSYRNGPPVLRDLNLRIEPGTVLGIVGGSGIGKTTLQHLLSRMMDVKEGDILIGSRNVRDWPLRQLRGMFASVSQNGGVLFSQHTVLETLRFARPDASFEEVVDAARCACIHTEIERMPEGYNTLLGPGGVHPSKGQLQRIGIAQTLLASRDKKVLILDEFTSALDSRTEQQVIDNLKPRLQGKTVIIIAHRLATLRKLADRIVVLDRGGIVEDGSHAELVSMGNRYAELVRLQNIA
jgi:ABC-type multidrug transport system fused ATPase/permease subunit